MCNGRFAASLRLGCSVLLPPESMEVRSPLAGVIEGAVAILLPHKSPIKSEYWAATATLNADPYILQCF